MSLACPPTAHARPPETTPPTRQALFDALLPAAMRHYLHARLAPRPAEEADVLIEETLKFLQLAAHVEGSIPVSQTIDEVWHAYILQTAEYAALCSRIGDGRFIHHSSHDYNEVFEPDVKTRPLDVAHQVAILASYVLNFGPFTPEGAEHWNLARELMALKGWTLGQLNAWLAEAA